MAAETLSYLHGASPIPLLGETIGENLDRTAARVPDNDALVSVHQGIRQTYAEFHAAVEEVARGLLALGIEPGERVGIWSPNNAEWVTLQYATAKVDWGEVMDRLAARYEVLSEDRNPAATQSEHDPMHRPWASWPAGPSPTSPRASRWRCARLRRPATCSQSCSWPAVMLVGCTSGTARTARRR